MVVSDAAVVASESAATAAPKSAVEAADSAVATVSAASVVPGLRCSSCCCEHCRGSKGTTEHRGARARVCHGWSCSCYLLLLAVGYRLDRLEDERLREPRGFHWVLIT